jgi:hypothetical protein
MLHRLEKGSATVIEFVNVAVLLWGERLGVPTPVSTETKALALEAPVPGTTGGDRTCRDHQSRRPD